MLVTGGEGFIGSHLVDLLVEKGFKVYSIDNSVGISGWQNDRINPKAEYYSCDIRNFDKLLKFFLDVKPHYVFHTAALARIQPSIKDPRAYLEVNSMGTLNVLLASREAGVKRVIYSASSSAYGLNKIPLMESMTPDPLNPYAKTKLDGEQWMKLFAKLYGLETISLRYFNVYGPRNAFSGPYTTVITKFLHLRKEGKPMPVVGSGKQTRDYTHVSDIVRGNLLAALSKKGGHGEVINLGCGEQHSVNEIAKLIGGKVEHEPPRRGEALHTLADRSLAKKLLGWEPNVKFKEGVQKLKKLYGIW